MAVVRRGGVRRKRELIEEILKDLSPGLRDEARRILLEQDLDVLLDREKALGLLRRRGLRV